MDDGMIVFKASPPLTEMPACLASPTVTLSNFPFSSGETKIEVVRELVGLIIEWKLNSLFAGMRGMRKTTSTKRPS